MNKTVRSSLIMFILPIFLLSGCGQPVTATPPLQQPTPTASPITPTETPQPTATATSEPSPTPLPGNVVLPVDSLGKNIPWLPLDKTARPGVNFVGFNTQKAPFNIALVRQAFAYAIDREVILGMAIKYHATNPTHASTLTPPETLGRDLYGQIGIMFDPQRAKDLLAQAGFSNPANFPRTIFIVNVSGDIAPSARINMANALVDMWKTNLGVQVEVQAIPSFSDYTARLSSNPPDLFWMGWMADDNDPDNFLRQMFHSGTVDNFGKFSDSAFDRLVDMAKYSGDPAQRQILYIQAERLLCETQAALIPLFHIIYKSQ